MRSQRLRCLGALAVVLAACAVACMGESGPREAARMQWWACNPVLCGGLRQSGAERVFVIESHASIDLTLRRRHDWHARVEEFAHVVEPPVAELVVAAGETREVMRVRVADERHSSMRYFLSAGRRFPFSIHIGSERTQPDETATYAAPFGGHAPGIWTSAGEAPAEAGASRSRGVFAVAAGTPVLAARAGTVLTVIEPIRSRTILDPALSDETRAVLVLHDDGTIATYANLDVSVGAKPGQRAERGRRLGEVAAASDPKGAGLRFDVEIIAGTSDEPLPPIRLVGDAGAEIPLEIGRAYAPAREVTR